ncbi:MAG: hypothetical protein WC027_01700 [Candidatus Paceibacterota bacterium]
MNSKIIFSILAILLGIFLFIYGGYDDSPGAQGLGLLVVIVGAFNIVRDRSSGGVIDIELTLNRWGLGKIAENKFQFLCLRFSKWKIPGKYSISFEINWKIKDSNTL